MNGPQITVDDVKDLLLDLYLAQRENAVLRAQMEARENTQSLGEEATDA